MLLLPPLLYLQNHILCIWSCGVWSFFCMSCKNRYCLFLFSFLHLFAFFLYHKISINQSDPTYYHKGKHHHRNIIAITDSCEMTEENMRENKNNKTKDKQGYYHLIFTFYLNRKYPMAKAMPNINISIQLNLSHLSLYLFNLSLSCSHFCLSNMLVSISFTFSLILLPLSTLLCTSRVCHIYCISFDGNIWNKVMFPYNSNLDNQWYQQYAIQGRCPCHLHHCIISFYSP